MQEAYLLCHRAYFYYMLIPAHAVTCYDICTLIYVNIICTHLYISALEQTTHRFHNDNPIRAAAVLHNNFTPPGHKHTYTQLKIQQNYIIHYDMQLNVVLNNS